MTFDKILLELKNNKVVRRNAWHKTLVVFLQIPAVIDFDSVYKMKSLPKDMKDLLIKNKCGITYHDQFVMYDFTDKSCTYYMFDGEDLNSDDWEVINCNYDYN